LDEFWITQPERCGATAAAFFNSKTRSVIFSGDLIFYPLPYRERRVFRKKGEIK